MAEENLEYKTINPEENYDGNAIIQHYEDFQDMNKYIQTIKEDSENTSAWEDSGKLLHKSPFYYFNVNRSPRSDLEGAISEEYNNLAKYANKHSSNIFGKLKSEDYVNLTQKVPLYKTGDKGHDEFIDSLNEFKRLNEISKDTNKIFEYVQEKVSKGPNWFQISFMKYGENDLNVIFKSYLANAQTKVSEKMFDENKEVKKEFLEKVFKDSLSEAEAELSKEDYSEEEKNDLWEANVRPYYFTLLEEVYKREKEDEDKPQKKEDRDERRKARREKGMLF